jgi:hypothetical protein
LRREHFSRAYGPNCIAYGEAETTKTTLKDHHHGFQSI